jgi:hypothetical protein
VGYYGGINYGFGYGGTGFAGGRWVGNTFAYNRAVNNLNSSSVHNTYDEPPIRNAAMGKVSYNGGPGGTTATPTPQERAAASAVNAPTPAARAAVSHPAAVTVHRSTGVAHTVAPATPNPAPNSASDFTAPPRDAAVRPAAPKPSATAPTKPAHPTR